jgi:hypothetical protein
MRHQIRPLLCLGLVFTACSHIRAPAPLPPLEPIAFERLLPGKLVFQRYFVDGRGRDVEYVIDVDTRRTTPIVRWRLTSADFPAISPNGSLIAYSAGRRGIYIVDAAGGRARQVTAIMGDEGAPSWTPDGRQIVFVSRTFDPARGVSTIFRQSPVADAADRVAVRTYALRAETSPSGSIADRISVAPNGKLVFLGRLGISSMESDGSGVTLLMPFHSWGWFEYSAPSWSPAGDMIAFLETQRESPHILSRIFNTRVRIMNADGTNLRTLASVGAGGGKWLGDLSLCWSADGAQIAFTAPTGEWTSHLFVARLNPLDAIYPVRPLVQVTTAPGVSDGSVSCSR